MKNNPVHNSDAELYAQSLLRTYFGAERGRAARLAEASGISAPRLSHMSTGTSFITVETAMALHVHTDGVLPAELLCPSGAELLKKFKAA